jgi:hypothetical protein
MPAAPKQVMQFKITLRDVKPAVWRRIQVPANYTYWDLSCAVISAMGWGGYHLHDFRLRLKDAKDSTYFRVPNPEFDDFGLKSLNERKEKIAVWFPEQATRAVFSYDFGDGWEHDLLFEGFKPAEPGDYPRCLKGKNACPFEDCGGPWGYEEKQAIIKNPKHPDYKETLDWLFMEKGEVYDPTEWTVEDVGFGDPEFIWKEMQKYR